MRREYSEPLDMPIRLAIAVTHPIQYFSHVYRKLAQLPNVQIRVLYGSRLGLDTYRDPGFGVKLSWSTDLIGGFDHEFLPGADQVRALNWRSLGRVQVADALNRFDPDAVLLHGYSHPLVLRAWRWARAYGRKVILFGDGNGRHELARSALRRHAKRLALRPLLQSMHRVLSLGEANELHWTALGLEPSRIQWAPMYLPSPDLALQPVGQRDAVRNSVRTRLRIADNQLAVICSGKFVPWKRTIDVVRGIDRDDRLVGIYVGDGECRQACEAAARSDRHRFVGFANVPQLAEYYAAGDILCHAAEREPYGLVVAEAAAAGLPIVASRVVGAIGARSHGQAGRNAETFEPRNVDALADALGSLATDQDRRNRMAAESLQVASEMEQAFFAGMRKCLSLDPSH
jgi:glycosyltransferase involved in cell wall biosynthesis